MLQASEYNIADYLQWIKSVRTFRGIENRKSLDMTPKATVLLVIVCILFYVPVAVAAGVYVLWLAGQGWQMLLAAVILVLSAPLLASRGIVVPLWLGEKFIQEPRERRMIALASQKLRQTKAVKIAIAGSYGKTTMREILRCVLASGRRVAASPGNYNTPHGVCRFVDTLDGSEEILIFEFGEYYPGDIMELSMIVDPAMGVITGINEAHLSKFKTISRTIDTIFEISHYLEGKPVYVNGDNDHVRNRAGQDAPLMYSLSGVDGWEVSDVRIDLHATEFTASKGNRQVHVKSGLLGRHMIGPIVAAISIAEHMGLTDEQIQIGIEATKPFEHRMAPRDVHGATIIDDTYNGNIDGVRSGIAWLQELQTGGRRVYVTPGLVEQGEKTAVIHREIGMLLAPVVDMVILMQNSVTPYIEEGLQQAGYKGEFFLIDKPLEFYKNIDHYVAAGDVVLMQNDWADNYS